jgi:surface polysaccharide O-acyltransferase-like enzyme
MEQVVRARNAGIDAARYFLLFGVVFLHAKPHNNTLSVVLSASACRAAVPFFFIAAGYFLRPGAGFDLDLVLSRVRRLLPPFIFWLVVYFLLAKILPGHPWKFRLRDLLNGGLAFHLWFLPALGLGLVFVGGGLRLLGPKVTGALSAALALWAIFAVTYKGVLALVSPRLVMTIAVPVYVHRFMMAPIYIFIGTLLARHVVKVTWPRLAGLVVLAYGLLVGEEIFIARLSGAPAESHEFGFCTFLFAVAVFLLMRSLPSSGVVRGVSGALGKVSLGVYAAHLLFVWVVEERIGNVSVGASLMIALIAFFCATILSLEMELVPGLRRLVT